MRIGKRTVGAEHPTFIIAELSCNHRQDYDLAVKSVEAAAQAGADAIKLQTYTPDTMTIDSAQEHFTHGSASLWAGRTLYDLYGEAFTPWDWHEKLQRVATDAGIELFSTPFERTAIDLLESLDVPAYKIASFELVDLQLIEMVAATGKPMIMSTGMATLEEIDEAVATARNAGARDLVLLKCTSAYPAPPEAMNLRAIPALAERFGVVAGLSDHTLNLVAPIAAVTLGARVIEKHFTLSRGYGGPDAKFSLEPAEFEAMVRAVRETEAALGTGEIRPRPEEAESRKFRRSLFVVRDMRSGEQFNSENVRSIRPGAGLHTRHLTEVLGRRAARDIQRGTPLSWELVGQ